MGKVTQDALNERWKSKEYERVLKMREKRLDKQKRVFRECETNGTRKELRKQS